MAVLKTGGAYLPLDPRYPQERLAFVLDDAQAKAVLTEEAFLEALGGADAQLIVRERARAEVDQQPATNLPAQDDPHNLAYVIYTSGSTGRPKGVMVSHANVATLLHATSDTFGFNREDRWTFFHSYAFDFSVWEIWGALLHGAQVVVVPYDVSRSPATS